MLRRSAGELEWREGAALGVVALAALLAMDAYVRDSPTPQNDELIYDRMASDPFDPHTFPFAYRVAVPLAARFLPFSRELSFSLLMRPFPIPKRLAAGIGLGLALCPTLFVVSLRQGFSADPESVFVMLASAPGLAAYAALRLSIPTVAAPPPTTRSTRSGAPRSRSGRCGWRRRSRCATFGTPSTWRTSAARRRASST